MIISYLKKSGKGGFFMKKIFALVLAFILCFSGCGSDPTDEPADSETLSSGSSVSAGETSEEPETENPDDKIMAKYLGDWNGLLQIYDAFSPSDLLHSV